MGDCMHFPDTFEEFLESYCFKDRKEIYTNGSTLIPLFRVQQGIEHYYGKGYRGVYIRGNKVGCPRAIGIMQIKTNDTKEED